MKKQTILNEARKFSGLGFCVLAALIVLSSLIMMHGAASIIPHWDSWDGQKLFIYSLLGSESIGEAFGYLMAQHNEHRIVLTKLLFIVDEVFFEGKSYFLLFLNAVFPAIMAGVLVAFSRDRKYVYLPLILGFLFLFDQNRNLTWAFQSQFFLAQYVPLIGYLLLSRFGDDASPKFVLTLLGFAFLSMFTMANGMLFAAPLLLYYMVCERNWSKSLSALAALAGVFVVNFVVLGYEFKQNHGSLTDVFGFGLAEFGRLFLYIFKYFGVIFDVGSPYIYGVVFLVLCLVIFVRIFILSKAGRLGTVSVLAKGFVLFLLYYGASTLLTAVGRSSLGVGEIAIAGRYATPVVVAWLGVIIILAELFWPRSRSVDTHVGTHRLSDWVQVTAFGIVFCLLGVSQYLSIKHSNLSSEQERGLSMLAMSMDIGGEELTKFLYPNDAHVRGIFDKHSDRGAAYIVDGQPYALANRLGQSITQKPFLTCEGQIDRIWPVRGGYWVAGWFVTADGHGRQGLERDSLYAVDAAGQVVGAGLKGFSRADVARALPGVKRNTGFNALIDARFFEPKQIRADLSLITETGEGCRFDLAMQLQYVMELGRNTLAPPLNILDAVGFEGSDFNRTQIEGGTIVGSYINGDSDVGRMDVQYHPDLSVQIITGPRYSANIRVELVVGNEMIASTPIYNPELVWFELNSIFAGQISDPENTIVRFVDAGDGWGEWLAVAIPD